MSCTTVILYSHPLTENLANEVIDECYQNHLEVIKGDILWKRFQDEWPNLFITDVKNKCSRKHVVFIGSLHSPDIIFEQIAILYSLPRYLCQSFIFILPYFPTATMERVDTEGRVATASTMARILSAIPLSSQGPCQIIIFDIHALQERFYFGDTVIPRLESAIPLLLKELDKASHHRKISITFPDDGAYKRFHTMFESRFVKPHSKNWDYPEIGLEAARNALEDAGINYLLVDAVVVSHVYGESTSGQKAVYGLGLTGIPIFNTNNNCSSASCALMLSKILVQSGDYKCVLALGFEKMDRGLTVKWNDRLHPSQAHFDYMRKLGVPAENIPSLESFTSDVLKVYAYGACEHAKKYGTTKEQHAKIAYKNHYQSQYNPKACLQKVFSMQSIMSQVICEPITLAMCALTADGGAAAVICSEDFMDKYNLKSKAVEIISQKMVTDLPSSFNGSLLSIGGYDMAKKAAQDCFADSGLSIHDIDIIELHDCFACNEVVSYVNLVVDGMLTLMVDWNLKDILLALLGWHSVPRLLINSEEMLVYGK
nr:sterol carrier protein 2 isoform X2 [Hydra vulgaris]